MQETPWQSNEEPSSLVEVRAIDRLCDRFEAAWRAGQHPAIETFLAEVPASARAAVLRELIAMEVEYRRRNGETPTPTEYETRFGEPVDVVASAFRRIADRGEAGVVTTGFVGAPDSVTTADLKPKGAWPTPALPGYAILDRLGAGGMGVVYKARQQSLHRIVALKLIRPDGLAGPRERARFQREAEAAARLRHPHVVQVYEIGEHDGQPYAVLEYVDGSTLAKTIAAGPMEARAAATLVEPLARAVQHAHDNGILHRDLKPANVLLTADGTPKVADFGLARWLGSASEQTASGEILGTPRYMAPEQAAGQLERLSPATDVYALGAILYELLTGRAAFRGRTPLEILEQVRSQEPTAPRLLRPQVPRDLEMICLKCLAKEPEQRYASATALADDLRRWLAGEPTVARPHSWPRRVHRLLRRHRTKAALLLTIVLTGAAVLAATALLRKPTPEELAAKQGQAALAAHEANLAAGKPVELIGASGAPPWYRIRTGAEATQVSLDVEGGTYSVHSWQLCLLELLPGPQRTSYRIRAEIRHDNSKQPGDVGLFFGLEEIMAVQGGLLSFGQVAFNDVESEVDLWRNIPPDAPGRPPEPKGNYSCIQPCLFGWSPDGGERQPQRVQCSSPPFVFKPAPRQHRWRSLIVEVNPERIRAYWEDGRQIGEITTQAWANSLKQGLSRDELIDRASAVGFAPRGGLGLYVSHSTASFRRVVVEPLGGEATPSLE
jgi:tRNA A-37 threonylcarbamoyl transferase component Bud32